jgi:hypothetical protein
LLYTTVAASCLVPSIDYSDTPYSGSYLASNALVETCEALNEAGSYFLLPDGATNKGFIVDIGCTATITMIYLKNARNGQSRDR